MLAEQKMGEGWEGKVGQELTKLGYLPCSGGGVVDAASVRSFLAPGKSRCNLLAWLMRRFDDSLAAMLPAEEDQTTMALRKCSYVMLFKCPGLTHYRTYAMCLSVGSLCRQ